MKYKIKLFYSAPAGGWIAVWKDVDDSFFCSKCEKEIFIHSLDVIMECEIGTEKYRAPDRASLGG